MKQTTNWQAKYAGCVAGNPTDNSTLAAANALAKVLSDFGTVKDIYVLPPSAGNPNDGALRYSQPEMLVDGVPPTAALCLYLDFQVVSGPVRSCNVGMTVDSFRRQPNDTANAIVQSTGVLYNSTIALYALKHYPELLATLNAAGAAVVAAEEAA